MFNLNMAAWKRIDKMFHAYGGLNRQRSSPAEKNWKQNRKKKPQATESRTERARQRDVYRYASLAAAHKSPAPTKASAPMCRN